MNTANKGWLGSIKAKVAALTAVLVALAGLANGAIDLYKGILRIPTNIYDKSNDELFKKNFSKQPLVSQSVTIKSGGVEVTMLLQVFEDGDLFG